MEEILKTSAIIVAAGKGRRMGREYNKQYILLGNKPIVAHTIEVFEDSSLIDEIILVVGKGEVDLVKQIIIEKYNFKKVISIVEGGERRQDSVYNGLRAIDNNCNIVLIHDGARPFITNNIIEEGIEVANKTGACIAAVPVKDTIKVSNESMDVVNTPNRETLWAVQTPQAFKYQLVMNAYEKLQNSNIEATDDAMIIERLGYTVKIIKGSYENIKITTPEDLILGEGILKNRKVEG
ncbi:2-C-methyl-D-erythritol 4-phosphate cytidylyltransferase [Alkaliphilus sp. MSJ-5]|uniref:2-C-methyl-D-erythritol 4-phosphate cytidylyltransferase n=1 Tax=Alkaliphilus flagellatus TaxID=2841507 RepID=A0ABS6G6Q0_9FIRM|nr:2-C-methyl-D-erythritol 4-phosphate cytidylyltransferase [Alkaliphilus flagellatus]MBU5678162.1 2-C-methyl-D-erythritol 4-phosphate cytidylyltransferase [Alkaliphilus flagellatus]